MPCGPAPASENTTSLSHLFVFQTCSFLKGASVEWIEDQKVPFAVKGDQWVGFENDRSVEAKVRGRVVGFSFPWAPTIWRQLCSLWLADRWIIWGAGGSEGRLCGLWTWTTSLGASADMANTRYYHIWDKDLVKVAPLLTPAMFFHYLLSSKVKAFDKCKIKTINRFNFWLLFNNARWIIWLCIIIKNPFLALWIRFTRGILCLFKYIKIKLNNAALKMQFLLYFKSLSVYRLNVGTMI